MEQLVLDDVYFTEDDMQELEELYVMYQKQEEELLSKFDEVIEAIKV